jgi:putative transcriptional regulator
MPSKLRSSFWMTAAVLCLPGILASQSQRVTDLGVGKLLVAPRNAPDPSFAESVVLLAQFDKNGALGLMINRRTRVPLSRVLEQFKAANNRSDPVYLGGPVELEVVMALLRSSTAPDKAPPVMPGIYLVSTRPVLEKALTAGTAPGAFHVYLGYCGWGSGQLENEIKLGGWYIFSGDADLIFDSDPSSLWSRLIDRTEQRFARTAPRVLGPPGIVSLAALTR